MAVVHLLITVFLVAAAVALVNVDILIWEVASPSFSSWWRSRPVVLFRLGGVTTLRRTLSYPCAMCQDSMEAGEKVRTLSCGHVFHCGGTVKCELGIDQWLLTGEATSSWQSCPICRQVPCRVLPWKRPPPSSSPAPSSSPQTSEEDSEEELMFPSHWFDETTKHYRSSLRHLQ